MDWTIGRFKGPFWVSLVCKWFQCCFLPAFHSLLRRGHDVMPPTDPVITANGRGHGGFNTKASKEALTARWEHLEPGHLEGEPSKCWWRSFLSHPQPDSSPSTKNPPTQNQQMSTRKFDKIWCPTHQKANSLIPVLFMQTLSVIWGFQHGHQHRHLRNGNSM